MVIMTGIEIWPGIVQAKLGNGQSIFWATCGTSSCEKEVIAFHEARHYICEECGPLRRKALSNLASKRYYQRQVFKKSHAEEGK